MNEIQTLFVNKIWLVTDPSYDVHFYTLRKYYAIFEAAAIEQNKPIWSR